MNRTNDTVIIAHDYLCPWCWVGFFHAQRLKEEFPHIRQDWRGYELLPEELGPLPDYRPQPRDPTAPLSRFELFAKEEGHPVPEGRTIGIIRTHNALEGAEYIKDLHPEHFDAYNEAVYRAFWERSEDISDIGVLQAILAKIGLDSPGIQIQFGESLAGKVYHDRIVRFDDGAYADDITHVPTFVFRGERCAEAPYATIRDLATRFVIWYGKKEAAG
jgi:predicted DsbA family dithiol-disulfide isomerase